VFTPAVVFGAVTKFCHQGDDDKLKLWNIRRVHRTRKCAHEFISVEELGAPSCWIERRTVHGT
jgi:hypothetical protein